MKNIKELKASDIMMRHVVTARGNYPAKDLTLQLLHGIFSGVPVIDDNLRPIGIVTELDLIEALQEGKDLIGLSVQDIMTREIIFVDVDTSVSEVITIMKEHNIIRVPVTENGKLVGVISRCDILKELTESEFGYIYVRTLEI